MGLFEMTDENKFGPSVNWTLTSDNKLKSGDGSCLFIDTGDKLVINNKEKRAANYQIGYIIIIC